MTHHTGHNPTADPSEMLARYRRAQALMQGILTKASAFNTTLVPHWINDSDCFWYERELKQGKEFRLVDASAETNTIAFDHQALAASLAHASGEAVNTEDLPISKIELTLSPLRLAFDAFGKRWMYSSEDNHCSELNTSPSDWSISPDGSKAAFLRDHNIWLRNIATGEECALTQDGEPFYGYASAPTAWGMNVSTGALEALWSPDSKRLFTLQVDSRQVNIEPIMQYVPQDNTIRPRVLDAERRLAHP